MGVESGRTVVAASADYQWQYTRKARYARAGSNGEHVPMLNPPRRLPGRANSLTLVALLLGCGEETSGRLRVNDASTVDSGLGEGDAPSPADDVGDLSTVDDAGPHDGPSVDVAAESPDRAAMDQPDLPLVVAPVVIRSLETQLGVRVSVAGLPNRVTCLALDDEGVAIPDVRTSFEVRPSEGFRPGVAGTEVIGVAAGSYSVTCVAEGLGLRDESPALWDVLAGPAATVTASVLEHQLRAGDSADVTCEAADAQGNRVDAGDASVVVTPAGDDRIISGRRVTFLGLGWHRIDCELPGAVSIAGAAVLVRPGLPAALRVVAEPERAVYETGEIVTLRVVATDLYDNRVDDLGLAFGSAPLLPPFGEGRFQLVAEGRYTLSVCTTTETASGEVLCAELEVAADSGGPLIRCSSPEPGTMITVAGLGVGERPGPVRLEGEVDDLLAIEALTVGGLDTAVDADGRFAVDIIPTWGLNVIDIVARDAAGSESSTFCAFFASSAYADEAAQLDDAATLVLMPGAIDDGAPSRPLGSLADLLRAAVDSPALVATLDASLRAQNPVLPNECRQRVFGVCVLSVGAEYRGLRVNGPSQVSARLVNGGLRMAARIDSIDIDVQLLGTVSNSGRLRVDYIEIDLEFATDLQDGRPQITLRQVHAVNVGPMSSNFDGFLAGPILDLVFGAFEGTVRDTASDAIRGYLEAEIDALLTGVFAGLDVSALDQALSLPSLGGGPPIEVEVGFGFSTLSATPEALRLGVGTRARTAPVELRAIAGVPLPPGPVSIAFQPRGTAGASVSLGLLNQILTAVWRGGLFAIEDGAGLTGGLPEGGSLSLRILLPPAAIATGDGNALRISLGPALATIVYPGLFDEPLSLEFAATALASVSVNGGTEISFGEGGIVIDRLALRAFDLALSPAARMTLERLLGRLLQRVLDASLNGALPSLPVPDFALPNDLARFGFAPGTRLGLRDLQLESTQSHWLVSGRFGE